MWSRRAFLRFSLTGAALAGPLLLGRRANALGDKEKFQIAQLVYTGGQWQPRASALRRLLWEIDKRTSIDPRLEPAEVRLLDPELRRYPLLYLAGDGEPGRFRDDEVERLRRHLQAGGFLVADNAEGRPGGGFDRAVRQLAARLFPGEPLDKLPEDHVIYKSFYLLQEPSGRVMVSNHLEGLVHDGRVVLIYCQNDLGGAWARDNFGRWEYDVFPGGDRQRELAFRLGVNLAMYATCLDYKTDQVHVPFILRRRRWRVP